MKKVLFLALVLAGFSVYGQSIDSYFDHIRNNTAELTAFFSAMPKGGDLHNHYSGSVYAETYINYVVSQDYLINTHTLEVKDKEPEGSDGHWEHFSDLTKAGTLAKYEQKLIQKWSVKDYNGVSYPSDLQFFETFSGFSIANNTQARLDAGIMELKQRAQKENVSYIETMFTGIPCSLSLDTSFNTQLELAQNRHDEAYAAMILERMYDWLERNNVKAFAASYNDKVASMHSRLHIDDSTFTMRYQNYVTRVVPPADVFKALVVSFESANASPLMVGVNIVAPENNDVSMRDYWLHMQMFKFCHTKFPSVKYSMHAGELALGMVKPEELTWHINAAVHMAGANRIGHGVDMPFEKNCYDLLHYMASNKIPIEINLYSNEFILKIKDDQHPFDMYKEFNVPIVICTDDAGVLRSNLIEQYVLLAKRYKDVTYQDIKKYVYNSIDYSFIKETSIKERLKAQLNTRFEKFERDVLATH